MTEAGPEVAAAAAVAAVEFAVAAAAADPSLAVEGPKPTVGLKQVVGPSCTKRTPKKIKRQNLVRTKVPLNQMHLHSVQSPIILFSNDGEFITIREGFDLSITCLS